MEINLFPYVASIVGILVVVVAILLLVVRKLTDMQSRLHEILEALKAGKT